MIQDEKENIWSFDDFDRQMELGGWWGFKGSPIFQKKVGICFRAAGKGIFLMGYSPSAPNISHEKLI